MQRHINGCMRDTRDTRRGTRAGTSAGLVLLAALLLLPASMQAAAQSDGSGTGTGSSNGDGPALWHFEAGGRDVYLFGTIHLMKSGVSWFDQRIEEAFSEAETLVVELDPTGMSRQEQRRVIRRFALLPEGEQLSDTVSEERMERLMELLSPMGIPRQTVERWEAWYAGLTVVGLSARQAGFAAQHGVERRLLEEAQAAEMEIRELEGFTEQMELFDGLSSSESAYFLADALEEHRKVAELFGKLKRYWMNQDLEALEELVAESQKENPSFYETVYAERNRDWAETIEKMAAEGSGEPGDLFVAVGTAHFVGDSSLPELLRERGYELTRH
jgi:hypothetical protein